MYKAFLQQEKKTVLIPTNCTQKHRNHPVCAIPSPPTSQTNPDIGGRLTGLEGKLCTAAATAA